MKKIIEITGFELRIARTLGHNVYWDDVHAINNLGYNLHWEKNAGCTKEREDFYKKAIENKKGKILAAKKAAKEYKSTGLLETGNKRSYHELELRKDGIWGYGATCCDSRKYGCSYLGNCTAKRPNSGWIAKKS